MCTVLLPPADNPIAVNKYNIWFGITSYTLLNSEKVLYGQI